MKQIKTLRSAVKWQPIQEDNQSNLKAWQNRCVLERFHSRPPRDAVHKCSLQRLSPLFLSAQPLHISATHYTQRVWSGKLKIRQFIPKQAVDLHEINSGNVAHQ